MTEQQSPGGLISTGGNLSDWATTQSTPCFPIPASAARDYGQDFLAILNRCVCFQPWSGVTGRTCPAHGYIAPMQITC